MYHIKNDRRAIRSAEIIYEALAALMAEKPFEEITISELAEEAQIGRATFYRNFDFIEDVLRWHCDQILDELIPHIFENIRLEYPGRSNTILKPMLRFFYSRSTIVELLITARRTDILRTSFEERIKHSITLTTPEKIVNYLDYWAVLRSNMAVSILVQWVKVGKQQTPDELADGLADMFQQMVKIDKFLF